MYHLNSKCCFMVNAPFLQDIWFKCLKLLYVLNIQQNFYFAKYLAYDTMHLCSFVSEDFGCVA